MNQNNKWQCWWIVSELFLISIFSFKQNHCYIRCFSSLLQSNWMFFLCKFKTKIKFVVLFSLLTCVSFVNGKLLKLHYSKYFNVKNKEKQCSLQMRITNLIKKNSIWLHFIEFLFFSISFESDFPSNSADSKKQYF